MKHHVLLFIGLSIAFISCDKNDNSNPVSPEPKASGVLIYALGIPIVECQGTQLTRGSFSLGQGITTSKLAVVFLDESGNPLDVSSSDYDLVAGSGANYIVSTIYDESDRWSFRLQSGQSGTTYIKVKLRKSYTVKYMSPEIPVHVH